MIISLLPGPAYFLLLNCQSAFQPFYRLSSFSTFFLIHLRVNPLSLSLPISPPSLTRFPLHALFLFISPLSLSLSASLFLSLLLYTSLISLSFFLSIFTSLPSFIFLSPSNISPCISQLHHATASGLAASCCHGYSLIARKTTILSPISSM